MTFQVPLYRTHNHVSDPVVSDLYEIYLIKIVWVGNLEIMLVGVYILQIHLVKLRIEDLLYYSAVMITEVELWFGRGEKQYFPKHKLL